MEQEVMQSYIDGLNHSDAKLIGSLFAADGQFNDAAGRLSGAPVVTAVGSDAVRAVFERIFARQSVCAKVLKMNLHSMEYDVIRSDGTIYPCIGTVMINTEGKITEYLVRPR